MPPTATATKPDFRWKRLHYFIVIVALFFAARFFHFQDLLKPALDWVAKLGCWGPAIFVGIYAVASVLLIPGSVLTLGAGAVFGLVKGVALSSIASTLAATAAFQIGRHLAREKVARKIEGNQKFAAIDRAVGAEGWKIVLLTRLSPIFPFTLLNYAFGLTKVRLSHYILASWIGMMPGTAMYVYLGSLAKAVSDERTRTPGEWVFYGVGLLATAAVTVLVTRMAKQALEEKVA